MKRRNFLNAAMMTGIGGLTLPATAALYHSPESVPGDLSGLNTTGNPGGEIKPRICLNAYSFNRPLRNGTVSLEEMFRFAAATGFEGIDLTAYYIPEYPEVPDDKVLFDIKKMAFRYGLGITGTGVRNDFTLPDAGERAKQVQLVKNWIIAASKMGAPHVRVFDGKYSGDEFTRAEVKSWIIEGFKECADFGAENGVMVAYQNHDDYIVYTPEIIEILETVPSEWFGLMLDIGSLPVADPYREIEKLIPYAITWQVKENVKTGNGSKPTDIRRLMEIVDQSGYQGYFPLETLGEGDPFDKVQRLYSEVRAEMK